MVKDKLTFLLIFHQQHPLEKNSHINILVFPKNSILQWGFTHLISPFTDLYHTVIQGIVMKNE